jgi:hypothetical protein
MVLMRLTLPSTGPELSRHPATDGTAVDKSWSTTPTANKYRSRQRRLTVRTFIEPAEYRLLAARTKSTTLWAASSSTP